MALLGIQENTEAQVADPVTQTRSGKFIFFYFLATAAFLLVAMNEAMEKIPEFPVEIPVLFLNGILSIIGQCIAIRSKASVHYVSFMFNFIFMAVAPLIQVGASLDPVFGMEWSGDGAHFSRSPDRLGYRYPYHVYAVFWCGNRAAHGIKRASRGLDIPVFAADAGDDDHQQPHDLSAL
ncbi:MAG: hypothetical protein HY221_01730 [Candidatus Sungbacteria bacterium]|uniref:Uncharacterized protein n=1 Tax=Candidatus Sungiibacteriota bacterium TaxID=2750080 RepID=A0A932VPM5_9BACT|nr:hypothetical protein [Candidatus Sungbacteria bacterium]